jgi:hypothetical protein
MALGANHASAVQVPGEAVPYNRIRQVKLQ